MSKHTDSDLQPITPTDLRKADLAVANGVFKLKSKRNYRRERTAAIGSLFEDLELLIGEKETGDVRVWQVALCLILCGLPYLPTDETSITRRARLADGSWLIVTFTATGNKVIDEETGEIEQIPLPFGADRGPLYFIINKAIMKARALEKQGLDSEAARFIEWDRAADYMDEMNITRSNKNRRDLKARMQRIKYCAITVTRTRNNREQTIITPILSRTDLPKSIDPEKKPPQSEGTEIETIPLMGIEFNTDFFKEFLEDHVPVPIQLLRATMGRSQLQDYVLWLYWRAYATAKDTVIPWKAVRQQLWQNDSNEYRLKEMMKKAIRALQAVWPEFRAEVDPKEFGPYRESMKGLMVGIPRDRKYMLPGVQKKVSVLPAPNPDADEANDAEK